MLKIIIFSALFSMLCTMRGVHAALWIMWPMAFLLSPAWHFGKVVGSLELTYIGTTALIAVMGFLFTSSNQPLGSVPRKKLVLTDLVIFLIPVGTFLSVATNHGINFLSIPSIFLTILPYVVGRLYLRRAEDLQAAIRPVVAVSAVLCPMLIIESLGGYNLFHVLLEGRVLVSQRQGYGRAVGASLTTHTLGLLLMLFLPWLLEARRQSRLGIAPRWWRFAPAFNLVSGLATLSRGPVLAAVTTLWINQFFQRKHMRKLILSATVIGGLGVYFLRDTAQWYLLAISGETEAYSQAKEIIHIDGKEYVYTGSTHRILLYKVWRKQMETSGLFGYDNTFEMPSGEHWKFWSIDNHYVYTRVRWGWVGLQLFNLLTVLTLYRLGRLALAKDRYLSAFAGSLFAAVASFALALFTVALTRDSTSGFYFVVGLAATLCGLPEPEPEFDDDEPWDEDAEWDAEHPKEWEEHSTG
jgi:hypothetical protein